MSQLILKILFPLFFLGIFIYVIFNVEYPQTITQATLFQLMVFFVPLFLALTFSLNLFFKNFISSGAISSGIIVLLLLKALDSLNIVSAILTILASFLLVSYFQKAKKKSLTNYSKIPKLTSLRRKK